MLTLQLVEGDRAQTLKLEQDLITIGRSKENTIVLVNKKVSRKHARIERVGATYQVTDLESGNGTKINGEKVGFHALVKGDEIKVGDAVLKVQGIDEGPDRIELDDVGEETGLLDAATPVDGVKLDEEEIKVSGEDDDITIVEKLDDAPAPKAAAPAPKPEAKPAAAPAAPKPGAPSRLEAAKAKLAAMKQKPK
jgi:pSer/pThr/pTyr-binding forkhead associated (FHA) protein